MTAWVEAEKAAIWAARAAAKAAMWVAIDLATIAHEACEED